MNGVARDPIRHVVHLILENRSFDQMLGCFQALYPALDGIDPSTPRGNVDSRGKLFEQKPTTERQMLKWDPHHEVDHVLKQLADHNSGFVHDFSEAYPDSTDAARECIMGYYPLDFLPALHPLARHFTICDHWFSSLPGPTWPNRFFALSGTANGRVNMPNDGTHRADLPGYFQQSQETLFDRLNDAAIHWKIYFHDIPQTTVLVKQRQPHNVARYFYIDQLFRDAADAESNFPQYCLIEPQFMGYGQNDAHPPHDIMRAEKLIADLYNALRANDALWQSTLFIIMYDEHGGFYDHVEPPTAVPPDHATPSEYSFDRLGVRVPALLVSPWVCAGVESTQFDHTSVLRYLSDKWGLAPLGQRTAAATSIAVAMKERSPRLVPLTRIELSVSDLNPPDPQREEEAFGILSAHQTALQMLAAYLENEAFRKVPGYLAALARVAEALKSGFQWISERALEEPPGFRVSLAEPDKLSPQDTVRAKDAAAKFIIRAKRYAAQGVAEWIERKDLSPDQQRHSLQTLALISGRNFHQEDDESLANAQLWLTKHRQP
jgi:phospholipase C